MLNTNVIPEPRQARATKVFAFISATLLIGLGCVIFYNTPNGGEYVNAGQQPVNLAATPMLQSAQAARPYSFLRQPMQPTMAQLGANARAPSSVLAGNANPYWNRPLQVVPQGFRDVVAQAATAADPSLDASGSIKTLTRYMIQQSIKDPEKYQDMESLMSSIQMACKQIASMVARAGISDLTGLEEGGGSVNVQGEEQKKLDVISNDVLKNALRFSGKVGVVGSEEEDAPVLIEEAYSGKYVAVFDPLDGSSNIDAAISTGTIFGIFEEGDPAGCTIPDKDTMGDDEVKCLVDTLQPGTKLVASGYVMYSSSTILVMTMGNGVNGFTLDPAIGEFVLTHPNIKVP
jgi:hypothetical protein